MRLAMLALVCAFVSPILAATYHVKSGTTCSNHGTVLGGSCITSSTCGAVETPCCDLEAATNIAALQSGDIIELHNQTHSAGSVTVGSRTYMANLDDAGVTIRKASGDTATVDGGGSVWLGLYVTGINVTVDGIVWQNFFGAQEGNRGGVLHWSNADGGRIRNNTIDAPDSQASSEFGTSAIRMSGGADGFIIEDNTFQGEPGNFILSDLATGTSGLIIRRNTFSWTACSVAGGARGVVLKSYHSAGTVAIYNNVWTSCPANCSSSVLFMREIEPTPVYFFNNRIGDNCFGSNGGVYTQDNACNATMEGAFSDENVYVFNNTWDDGASAGGNGVHWQNYFSSLKIRNNIMDRVASGIRGYTSGNEGGCGHNDQARGTGTDFFQYNILENTNSSLVHGSSSPDPTSTVTIANNTVSASAVTVRDANQRLSSPTSGGMNDPIGQGADVCSFSVLGETIDCSVDFDGDNRGTVWDIGADEYVTGQSCGNNVAEGSEVCDGTDFGTDSCVGRGFAGGTLTCNSCTSITTENCTLAGVSRSVLQGVTLKGGTIK